MLHQYSVKHLGLFEILLIGLYVFHGFRNLQVHSGANADQVPLLRHVLREAPSTT